MYDSLTEFSCQLLFLAACCFEELVVVKPEHSRIVNAEKYLVFKRYHRAPELQAGLMRVYLSYKDDECFQAIFEGGGGYQEFKAGFIRKMNEDLVGRTTRALRLVVDRTEQLIREEQQQRLMDQRQQYGQFNRGPDRYYWRDNK